MRILGLFFAFVFKIVVFEGMKLTYTVCLVAIDIQCMLSDMEFKTFCYKIRLLPFELNMRCFVNLKLQSKTIAMLGGIRHSIL